jgi:hypothetical protein
VRCGLGGHGRIRCETQIRGSRQTRSAPIEIRPTDARPAGRGGTQVLTQDVGARGVGKTGLGIASAAPKLVILPKDAPTGPPPAQAL